MNTHIITTTLSLVAFLQFKHFVCDGPLQTLAMVENKSIYGAWLGILHSGLHGVGTLMVFFFAGFSILFVLGLAVLDFVIHYHVDYTKENIIRYFGWGTNDARFWWALSADQALHQFTYLVLVALAFRV